MYTNRESLNVIGYIGYLCVIYVYTYIITSTILEVIMSNKISVNNSHLLFVLY